MSNPSKSSTPQPDEPLSPLERMARRFDAHMRASGRTVEVMEPSDTSEFVVTLPQGRRPKQPATTAVRRCEIAVEWGYEVHAVTVSAEDWSAIQQGEERHYVTQGWSEGQPFEIRWLFNGIRGSSLVVDYGGDGAQGFIGNVKDARARLI